MTSPAQDLKSLLDANSGLSLEFGVDLFVGDMPETPDSCVCLFDTPGFPVGIGPFYTCSAQVLVRGAVGSYVETYSLTADISSVLHEYYGTPSGSSFYYTGIWAAGVPFFIGMDDSNRPLFSINFRIQRR